MNKFFLFFLFFCLEIGKSDVIIKKNENKLLNFDNKSKLERYEIKGKIFNISKYSNYERITIQTDEERKRVILENITNLKDNDFIFVICSKYDYGEYSNCDLIKNQNYNYMMRLE